MNKEPWISIEGVLHDVKAGVLEIDEALKEIKGYFVEADTTSDTPMISGDTTSV